jgi:hypothetical protein
MRIRDVSPVAPEEQRVPGDATRWTHCMEKSNGYPRAEPRDPEACLQQYVEEVSGEPARLAALQVRPTLSQRHIGVCGRSHRE